MEAYAADAGDKQGNLLLSQKRAAAIAAWFSAHGVDNQRLAVEGHGDNVALNDTNQRIELVKCKECLSTRRSRLQVSVAQSPMRCLPASL